MSAGLELMGALALPILGLSALYARYRVLHPVSHMAAVLHELAHGNLDVDMPQRRGRGGVVRLQRAAAHLRETARQARAFAREIAAERDALRAELAATKARTGRRVETVIDETESHAVALAAPDAGLRGAIVQVLRGQAVSHDRRKAARLTVALPARLEYRGTAFPGVVLNMSQGGVRFRQDDGLDVPLGAIASLIVRGMPSVAVQVMDVRSGLASLAFAFQSTAEREDFAAFVEEIGQMALAA